MSSYNRLRQRLRRSSTVNKTPICSSWNEAGSRVLVTGDSIDFDPETISNLFKEGFAVVYLPYQGDPRSYQKSLEHLADPLEGRETYAIIAYGEAATQVLDLASKSMPKVCALIAYYPLTLPPSCASPTSSSGPNPRFPTQIHLASSQPFGPASDSYTYPGTLPGFAEIDSSAFSKPASGLSWSRTLAFLREAFHITVDLGSIWDRHTELEFALKDADATMATMVHEPYVNHVPTMTGGIGHQDLRRFYADFFIPGNPADLEMAIISRTVGSDRVVDELFASFTHDCEIPWMLSGVPPTGKRVEIAIVAIVKILGGKLCHEHIYWDQASVLVQIGLLDPGLVPTGFRTVEQGKETEVKRLPVVGGEGARKVRDEEDGESNKLMKGW